MFILVRDVPEFEELYADGVLALVESLDFTGPTKRPQRIVQEGCLPFDPTSKAEVKKVKRGSVRALPGLLFGSALDVDQARKNCLM